MVSSGTLPARASSAARGLEAELRRRVRGEVRFDDGSRALYATDASNYRQVPIGVVIPLDTEDVIETVAACRSFGAPLLPRGCGTSLAGQCCNVAVIIDFSKYLHEVLEIDPSRKQARVQPGTVLDDLRDAAECHKLTFGPDPATHSHCTLGGMIGNNSCGTHSLIAGKTADNIDELEILTYDGLRLRVGRTSDAELKRIVRAGGRQGDIYRGLVSIRDRYAALIRERFPDIPRRVSGYGLDQLLPENGFNIARALVGAEGTCVTVLEATTRLISSPQARVLLVLGYPDIYRACDHIEELLEQKPIGLEGFSDEMITDMRKKGLYPADVDLLPQGRGWLLVEFGADTPGEATAAAERMMQSLQRHRGGPAQRLFADRKEQARVWKVRESALGAVSLSADGREYWGGWEDSAVPPASFGSYLRDLRDLMNRYSYDGAFYGHFGQGCLHTRLDFDLVTRAGIEKFRSFVFDAADLVVHYGGSVSGEHGDGQARAALLPKMYGEELMQAFREFKALWDPDGRMNPGKVVDAYRIDQNLRLGTGYQPAQLQTHFQFPDDEGSFVRATLRCVGVGKCRREAGGTMCPSYMVTHEEADATRGRAHLLFEMLQGEVITDSWRSQHVKDALDLCLACKGCKGDCPVGVDMATYKAEFLSHYYAGRLRPLSAYSMGLIYWWARLASLAPGAVNFLTHAPLLERLLKLGGGIALERTVPVFAKQTFKEWYRHRQPRRVEQPRVILWPDTFNNHFFPDTAKAAVAVLEDAGFSVSVPQQSLCCGRPLYDFGMLSLAKRQLRQILDALRDEIRTGTPVVGLEPSCVSVFRDELVNLFPQDVDARRLSRQTFLLSEFLQQRAPHYQPAKLQRKALVQGHCHQKALMTMEAEDSILKKLGLDYEVLDSGCCGMAGAFGFEQEHFDVSLACGERVLLPAVRHADDETLIIANGFSCREQIEQTTGRRTLHLAEALQLAAGGQSQDLNAALGASEQAPTRRRTAAGAASAALLVVGRLALYAWMRSARQRSN